MLIAHFSDAHALSLREARVWHFLSKRLAGGVNLLTKRRNRHPVRLVEALVADLNRVGPDHVIVTGDLTNLSLPGEYALARTLLDGIDAGPSRVTIVPGNHDVYVWDAYLLGRFGRALEPYLRSDDADPAAGDEAGPVGETGPRRARFPVERVRGELAVIGIDTALPSPPPLADGWIGRRQLRDLEAALARHAGRFRVLAMHHPPVDNRWSILRALRDRAALGRVLARVGAELILHGHEHRDLRTAIDGPDGPIPVIGVGSASYDDRRPERRARYNLYRVEGRRLVSVETRVHDPARDQFTTTPA